MRVRSHGRSSTNQITGSHHIRTAHALLQRHALFQPLQSVFTSLSRHPAPFLRIPQQATHPHPISSDYFSTQPTQHTQGLDTHHGRATVPKGYFEHPVKLHPRGQPPNFLLILFFSSTILLPSPSACHPENAMRSPLMQENLFDNKKSYFMLFKNIFMPKKRIINQHGGTRRHTQVHRDTRKYMVAHAGARRYTATRR